jgi:hypothetical protein
LRKYAGSLPKKRGELLHHLVDIATLEVLRRIKVESAKTRRAADLQREVDAA